MTIRIEVMPDSTIEIMRPRANGQSAFPRYKTVDEALIVIKFLIKRDLEAARNQQFTPQSVLDARKAFRALEEKSPYGKKG